MQAFHDLFRHRLKFALRILLDERRQRVFSRFVFASVQARQSLNKQELVAVCPIRVFLRRAFEVGADGREIALPIRIISSGIQGILQLHRKLRVVQIVWILQALANRAVGEVFDEQTFVLLSLKRLLPAHIQEIELIISVVQAIKLGIVAHKSLQRARS